VASRPLNIDVTTRDVRFALETDARHVAITGASGGGKTTFVCALAGVIVDARGRIVVGDQTWLDARTCLAPERRRVGWVPQETLLVPHLGVRGNLRLGLRAGVDLERVHAVCGTGALADRSIARLSGGEQKRVALARALCSDPRLLLLDETFSALDGAASARLRTELRRYCDERAVITLTVTHHPAQIAGFCDEVYVLRDGHLQRL
jgi:molybdate transport system ATP-binding protein